MSFGSEKRIVMSLFMRRSEIIATCAAPVRSASNASASCIGWKLPFEIIVSRSISTIGLSPIAVQLDLHGVLGGRTCSR